MSQESIYLSIIIPCFNESKKVIHDIDAVLDFFRTYSINGEVIIVDDGSSDNTFNIAKEYSQKYSNVLVLGYEKNRGKGFALKTGFLAANGEYALFADSGLCVPFDNVFKGIELIKNGADIAIGSRRAVGAQILEYQPRYRIIGSKIFYFVVRTIIGVPRHIHDSQCGFKLFHRRIYKELFSQCCVERGMIDVEMILRAKKKRLKMVEFPVAWKNDPDSRYKLYLDPIRDIIQLIRIKYRLFIDTFK